MRRIDTRTIGLAVALGAFTLGFSAGAADDKYGKKKSDTSSTSAETASDTKTDRSMAGHASLSATLVDKEKKAQEKAAIVQVKVSGVKLTDPALANEQPKQGQAHLHYQVDNGPVIATTATKLSFHELSSGDHKITVMLAANDHKPLGPQETLEVKVP